MPGSTRARPEDAAPTRSGLSSDPPASSVPPSCVTRCAVPGNRAVFGRLRATGRSLALRPRLSTGLPCLQTSPLAALAACRWGTVRVPPASPHRTKVLFGAPRNHVPERSDRTRSDRERPRQSQPLVAGLTVERGSWRGTRRFTAGARFLGTAGSASFWNDRPCTRSDVTASASSGRAK